MASVSPTLRSSLAALQILSAERVGFHVRLNNRLFINLAGWSALSRVSGARCHSVLSSLNDFTRSRPKFCTNIKPNNDQIKAFHFLQPNTTRIPNHSRTMFTNGNKDFLFRQLLEYKSYTYTYLLADHDTNEAVIIDPVIDTVERDVKIINDLGLNLVYAANTHVHADHITGTGEIKKRIPTCKSMIAECSGARADVQLKEGDKVPFGKFELEVRSTPGHTDGCLTYVLHEKGLVFTGDALLVRGCGRTDFQQGSAARLYDSVHKKIFSLPQHYMVFPAHDYLGQTMSTIGEELRYNPRLTKPKNEFITIMEKLNLPYPKQIDVALPANLVCGVYDAEGKLAT